MKKWWSSHPKLSNSMNFIITAFCLFFVPMYILPDHVFWGLVIGCALSVLLNSMVGTNWRSSKFQS